MLVRDVIVVGAGLAGLMAVYRLTSASVPVIWIVGSGPEASNSILAQGGIAAPLSTDDSVDTHLKDTILAGDGLVEEDVARGIISEGAQIMLDLINMGVPFDRDEYGRLNLTMEGAHSRKRILHVKDATGFYMMNHLLDVVSSVPRVKARVIDLLVRDNTIYGVRIMRNDFLEEVYGASVILATGGYTSMYLHFTGSAEQDGVAVALAGYYGATLQDTEFIQFHPTVFFSSSGAFLITEAVRGEGAHLLDDRGDRFMLKVHPLAELAPRDIVARAIHKRGKVYLDFTPIVKKGISLEERFPNIVRLLRREGIDPNKDLVPVFPAAHYYIGGIRVNWWTETEIKRLMVIGEAASTGFHGANRLASNSLLECVVTGYRAAFRSWWYSTQDPISNIPTFERRNYEKYHPDSHLKGLMSRYGGIVKNAEGLRKLGEKILDLIDIISTKDDVIGSKLWAQVMLSGATVCSAYWRTESRGVHYREDFPNKWNEKKHSALKWQDIVRCLENMGRY